MNTKFENRIRQEIDTELSFLDSRPSCQRSVVSNIKGEKVVKKKISMSLAFVLILALLTGTVAVAATYRGVSWFLERDWPKVTIDPDYHLSDLKQNHTSQHLNAQVIDTYWDGLEFSIAYRISPVDPTLTLRMDCKHELHNSHPAGKDDADIILQEPEFVFITDGGDTSVYVDDIDINTVGTGWVYEEDGSLTVMLEFQLYDMAQAKHVGLPLYYTLADTSKEIEAYLHCYPTTLADPIAEHEHQWEPAICVSPKRCSICNRTEGELGYHDFQPDADGKHCTCAVCTTSSEVPDHIPASFTLQPGDYTNHVWLMQYRLSQLGYYTGPLSAKYDEATTDAVKAFQENAELEADGICSPEVLKVLFP